MGGTNSSEPNSSSSLALEETQPNDQYMEQNANQSSESGGEALPAVGAFCLADFEIIDFLGRGGYSMVCTGVLRRTRQKFAIKMIEKSQIVTEKQASRCFLERELLESIDCPFIVKLYGTFKDEKQLYYVLEYVDGSELSAYIRKCTRFTEDTARIIFGSLVLTLAYLHSKNIVYRDLKPKNVMVTTRRTLKLIDFGLSRRLEPSERSQSFAGTPHYLAPEVVSRNGHDFAVDWWTLGVLLFEILAGRPPFYSENRERLYAKISQVRFEFPSVIQPNAVDLIRKLLDRNPAERIKFVYGSTEDDAGVKTTGVKTPLANDSSSQNDMSRTSSAGVSSPTYIVKVLKDPSNLRDTSTSSPTYIDIAVPNGILKHPWMASFDWSALGRFELKPRFDTVFTPEFYPMSDEEEDEDEEGESEGMPPSSTGAADPFKDDW
eukprot:CAMPEP_0184372358 /NCGR_PEP_ID=MMETSP1089-20130417/163897_1 /TAXON_ID=38269 ORGANISM="Gloeochaete wittrockiana, Strain SAG46.84" /NCGR_SAMPLE_ID=MMETSP1089 /ASSEMBLY_ACC=CAM_ASM_000445 /LENGTH=433 /DNA_ID=CAMNT_0026715195 /DNA_START=31 /DNA_END=1332 /DNA_ORIENTATION=-